jgi:hypothetical protein
MQPVGADHKIKTAWRDLLKADQHAVCILLECGDRLIEDVANAWPSGLVQDGRKIAAKNFIGRYDASAAERLDRHFGAVSSGCVDPGNASLRYRHGSDLIEQAHQFHDRAAGATKINSLPARTWRWRSLHNSHCVASFA